MLLDHGWLRLLGGGSEGLPSLAEANALGEPTADGRRPGILVVGFERALEFGPARSKRLRWHARTGMCTRFKVSGRAHLNCHLTHRSPPETSARCLWCGEVRHVREGRS